MLFQELFDYIALKLAVFVSINTKTNPIAPKGKMGFTVSFPLLEGPAAAGGNVIRWKSFSVNEAVEFNFCPSRFECSMYCNSIV